MENTIKVGKTTIAVSNLTKIFFPQSKITKGDLISYYEHVAAIMAYHVKNHPLTVQRFPEGIHGESFYQKNASDYFPSWIKTTAISKEGGGKVHYVVSANPATYVYLANQGSITFHAWLSRSDKLTYPDRMIFDLDPSTKDFNKIKETALALKEILKDLELPCYPMTTGSHGMHVMVPLKRIHTFDEVGACALAIAQKLLTASPKRYTLEIRKEKRGSKIFLDTLRNRWSATSVVPYSVRPYEKAPVAMPLHWDEVKKIPSSQTFTIAKALDRLHQEGDAWKGVYTRAASLKKVMARLNT